MPSSLRARLGFHVAGALTSILMVGLLMIGVSNAAFTGSTDNPANNWAAGSVSLTDDDGGTTAMFRTANAGSLVPGNSVVNCIEVTYTGSTFSLNPVKLYGQVTAETDNFGNHLDIVIEEGTGGAFDDCGSFASTSVVFSSNTLTAFDTAHSNYGDGVTLWTPSSGDTVRSYRFTVTLGADTPNTAQGDDATATFTWEVQSG